MSIDIIEHQNLQGDVPDFKTFLLADPDCADDIEFPRNRDLPRDFDSDNLVESLR